MSPPTSSRLSRGQLLEMYRYMALHRAAEERLETLFKQGHVKGGLYRGLGQEAGAVGTAYALRRRSDGTGDIIGQTVREAGAVFLMGGTPLQYLRQYLARATAPTGGKEANVHWCDFQRGLLGPISPLGTMVEVMAGVTLSFRLRGDDRVGLVYSGDGATSTGAWHEGLNFAAAQRCPMILAVEHNQWAFSTPTREQTRLDSFVGKAEGYGVHGISVDGTDVLAVYDATLEAVARARSGEGPTMLEMRYYRMKGHAQHDAQEYVPSDELEAWRQKDPLQRFGKRLVAMQEASMEELEALEREAQETCREAGEQAVDEPPPPGARALEDVYTDLDVTPLWTRWGRAGSPPAPGARAFDPARGR